MAQALVGTVAGWFGGGALATAAAQLLTSVAFSAVARALGPGQNAQELLRDLALPTSLPAYRFVYGETRAAGTPAPVRVKGGILYACYILNSRPSAGPFTVLFDKRAVEYTGNPYDFSGAGAVANNDPFDGYAQYWIGRGDQTAPPALILSEAGDIFDATDAWRGLTVLWVRLDAGSNSSRADRWPSAPPEVLVDGKWSKVWDPRIGGQDPDDPATWSWSDNHALCALDALRRNPFAPYDDRNLWIETFEWAADVADTGIPVKAGGTIKLAANGTLGFVTGSELEDQVQPLLDAGAARWVRAGGRLGVIPAVVQDVALTITDLLDGAPARFSAHSSRDALATSAAGKFVAPDRAYELADLPAFEVPGALAADGGLGRVIQPQYDMVTDHRQGQWLQAIAARQTRRQRTMTAMVPPAAFKAVAGSWVNLTLPSPWTRRSGLYEVESMAPVFTDAEVGVVCEIEVALREISAGLFAWTPATDEIDVPEYTFDGSVITLAAPGPLITTSGADVALITGGTVVARVMFEFLPSTSASVLHYDWEWRETGGDWTSGGSIDADVRNGSGRVFGFLTPVSESHTYEIQVWAVAAGKVSPKVAETGITVTTGIPRWEANFEDGIYKIDRTAVSLGSVFTLTRAGSARFINASGVLASAATNVTRYDYATGVKSLLVEPAGANAWTYSEELDNAAWNKTRATITANATTAPDGTSTADKLVEDTSATNTHFLRRAANFVSGVPSYFSGFAKASGRDMIRVQASGTGMTTQAADIDLSSGAVTVVSGGMTVNAYAMASGWYWITVSVTPDTTVSGVFYVMLTNGSTNIYTGDGSSGAFVWGMQDGAGSYIATGAATATRAADVPAMQGITATLDIAATYGDGSTGGLANFAVTPGAWPALSDNRIRRLTGTP